MGCGKRCESPEARRSAGGLLTSPTTCEGPNNIGSSLSGPNDAVLRRDALAPRAGHGARDPTAYDGPVRSSGLLPNVLMLKHHLLMAIAFAPLAGFVPLGGVTPWSDSAAVAQELISVVAIPGQPYGVARIRLPVADGAQADAGQSVAVEETGGRIFYPATRPILVSTRSGPPLVEIPPGRGVGGGRVLGRITNSIRLLQSEQVERVVAREVWFLFRGDAPFTVVLGDAAGTRLVVRPQGPIGATRGADPRVTAEAHRAALADWWNAYTAAAERNIRNGDYPPLVENYLVSMLSRQLNLPLPETLRAPDFDEEESIASTLQLIGGTEEMRTHTLQRVAQGHTERAATADLPVPSPPGWREPPYPAADPDVAIEPMAHRVPANWFYVRFGSFRNYLWFRELSNQHGGDITRMVTLRGFDYGAARRAEDQLVLKATELSKLMGETVVEDMAFIGSDAFLTEGPSLGVLMKARNVFLLGTSLRNDRSVAARTIPGAKLSEVTIDGRAVSLLSTPDNRVRSFMVSDGDFFFVSTSRTLVRQFLRTGLKAPAEGEAQTGQRMRSLADTDEFRYARELMPLDQEYAVFAFFSSGFLQELVGPQYQIELRRRLNATADIAMVRLAQRAAAGEGQPLREIDALTAAGYLPPGLGRRPDGSGPIVAGDDVIDSRRGRRGAFLPIADVEITGVTEEEATWYRRRADFYERNWEQMDPVMAGIRRVETPGDGRRERLEIHAEVAPLVPEKYGWIASQLGPPTRVAIRFAPDDIATIQAHVVSDQLGGTVPPHHLFAAIKDTHPPNPAEIEGWFDRYRFLKSLPGYIGAWPQPGLIERLPLGIGRGRPVGPGMTRMIGGLYRFQGGDFSVLSFMPDLLTDTLPYLAAAEALDPAQVRLHVNSLRGTQLEQWVNQQLYQRSYQTSVAGARLLDSLTQQLKVEPSNAAAVAESLLDAQLQCPLGGEYVLRADGDAMRWVSTAWEDAVEPGVAPPDYMAPPLEWFRGVNARLTQYDARLVVDATLDMARNSVALPAGTAPPEEVEPTEAPPTASPPPRRSDL